MSLPQPDSGSVVLPKILALRECQQVIETRLNESVHQSFRQLSGLRLHVVWHEALACRSPDRLPVVCPLARQSTQERPRICKICQDCHHRVWRSAPALTGTTRRFKGACGSANELGLIRAGSVPLVALVVQARRAARPSSHRPHSKPFHAMPVVTHENFERGAALLRLIRDDLEMIVQLVQGKQIGEQRSQTAESHVARLQRRLRQLEPTRTNPLDQAAPPCAGGNAQRLVQTMIDYMHQHYQHPMTLGEVAATLGMNPDYLAHLFSRTTGVTFSRYLNELRLVKAEDLLRDPRTHVGEVAATVGFASADHFRHAFKGRAGVPPSVWRQE